MPFQHVITQQLVVDGRTIGGRVTRMAAAQKSLDETIPDESADLPLGFTLDVSACAAFMAVASHDLTLKTNSDSAPDDTIELAAGVPYIWYSGGGDFALTADVTALYATNDSGAAATLQIEALYDPTP